MSDVKFLPVKPSSRLQGFYRLSPAERRARLIESRWLAPEDAEGLLTPGLDEAGADSSAVAAALGPLRGRHGLAVAEG